MKRERNPEGERGFALLFVFLMAASIAILFYLELPRAAFESQRVLEGMLVERGEQYSRAVKLYVRKWNKYPANLEELENTNSVRYLRRRYRDPLTGKEEWRLIHVGPGGVFTDSLVYDRAKDVNASDSDKDKTKDGKAEVASTFITARPAFGSMDPLPDTRGERASRFRRKRDSEREKKQESEDDSATASSATSQTPDPNAPTSATAAGGYPQPGVNPQNVGVMPPPFPTMTQPTGAGMTPAASNQALDMIRDILTKPRQGGLAGLQGGGMQIGGGLAGVASKAEEEGIKVYNERTAYNEWEFVYDVRKDAAKATAAMTGSQGNTGMGTGIGTGMGTGIGVGTGTGTMPGMNSPQGGLPGQGR